MIIKFIFMPKNVNLLQINMKKLIFLMEKYAIHSLTTTYKLCGYATKRGKSTNFYFYMLLSQH